AGGRAVRRCCGSRRWAQAMAEARPFVSAAALVDAADRIWAGLNAADWLEAFAAHPRIGDTSAEPSPGPRETPVARASANAHQEWCSGEQSGVRDASAGLRLRLAEVNREYDARFGYRFIVCATGKTAGLMLAELERRLTNRPEQELQIATEEQRRITRLRIGKLLDSMSSG